MELHLLDYNEDLDQITSTIYPHVKDIAGISPASFNSRWLFTSHGSPNVGETDKSIATLWEINEINTNDSGQLIDSTGSLRDQCTIESSKEMVSARQYQILTAEYYGIQLEQPIA